MASGSSVKRYVTRLYRSIMLSRFMAAGNHLTVLVSDCGGIGL